MTNEFLDSYLLDGDRMATGCVRYGMGNVPHSQKARSYTRLFNPIPRKSTVDM